MSMLKVKWHYIESGNTSGIPMLFLHGFMAHSGIWKPVIEQLPDSMYAVALDLPGHGKTEADLETLDFEPLSDAVNEFIQNQFGRPIVLLGYSMGGRIALYTALKYPENFIGLILESTTPGIENPEERGKRVLEDKAKAEKLRSTDIRTYLTDWYKLPVFASLERRPDLVEKIINKKSANDPNALAEVVVRLSPGRQKTLWNDLDRWKKPTLVIAGELDEKFCTVAKKMAPRFDDADLKIIPGAGHIVHLENHKDFTAVLNFFLSSRIL